LNSTASDHCLISKTLVKLGFGKSKKEESSFSINVFNSIAPIQADWDALVPSNHPLSSACYQIYESTSPSSISYRYAIVYHSQKTVMCVAFQVVRVKPENLRPPQMNEFLKYATHLMLNMHEILLLVCGNVFKDGLAGFYYQLEGLSTDQASELLTKCIEQVDKQEGLSAIMLKDLPNNGFNTPNLLKIERLEDDISMFMDINPLWKSLDDYQADLSKKYVARAKKILASASDIEVKEMGLGDIEANKKTLHTLYAQVLKHQAFTFGALKEDYFVEVKKHYGDAFSLKGLYLNGKLVAFFSTITHANELEVHYIGMDYAFNHSHNLYFYIHFLVLQQAIEQKKASLDMGRTSLEAKAILGCKPRYNATYISFKNSLAECSYGYFKKNLSESDSWKTRNPLKEVTPLQLSAIREN
jgi:hypothetical protein